MPRIKSPIENDGAFEYNFKNELASQLHARRIISSQTFIFDELNVTRYMNNDVYITKKIIRDYFNDEVLSIFEDEINVQKAIEEIEILIPKVERVIDDSGLMKVSLDEHHYPEFDYTDVNNYARIILTLSMIDNPEEENEPIIWSDKWDISLKQFETYLYESHQHIDAYEENKYLHPIFNFEFSLKTAILLHKSQFLFIDELSAVFGQGF